MGYRSDVAIIIYGETDEVTAFVAGEKLHGKPKDCTFHPIEEPTTNYHERNHYTYGKDDEFMMMEFNWWDVKWYESFPEVGYWANLESVWDEAFPSLCMEVAVVGESVDDNRTDYYGNDPEYLLNISRAIEKNLP